MATNWKPFGQATKCATLLGGALLLVHTGPTQAQTALNDAAIPTSPATTTTQPGVELLELEFENIQVVDLLKVIAKTFNINVLINEDVSGTLHYVNIKGKSPQEALEFVARNAKLKLRRESDGTYQIGKNLDDEGPAPIPAVTPATGFGGLNNPTSGAALDPFGAPAITTQNSQRPANSLDSLNLPELVSPTTNKAHNSNRKGGATPVRLRNVKPSIMAYWLDPANNPVPIEFLVANDAASKYGTQAPARLALNPSDQAALSGGSTMGAFGGGIPSASPYVNPYLQRSSSSRIAPEVRSNFQFGGFNNNQNQVGGGNQTGGAGGGSFQLPGEIEEIIAIDAQNTLLVAGGTDEDIDRLREIIAILDRPLRQVEIEAQFVTVTTAAANNFGIDFSTSRGNIDFNTNGFSRGPQAGGIEIGFVRGNFRATLSALVSENRAKLVTAPRVTAINNLTASIQSQTSTPLILSTSNSGIGGQVGEQENLVYITTSIGLNVTPTINGDDTITVLMQPQLQAQRPIDGIRAPLLTSQAVQTVANIKDGDTIALGGLRTKNITNSESRIPLISDIPIIGKLFRTRGKIDDESELIIFVTARIVRRADDDFVPGT